MTYTPQQQDFISHMNAIDAANVAEAKARYPKPKKAVKPKAPKAPKVKSTKPKSVKPPSTGGTAPGLDPATKSLLDAAVRLKFGGVEQGYQQQLQGAQRFASGVPTWYSQAIQQIQSQQQAVPQVQAPVPTGDPAQDSRANLNAAFGQQQAQRVGASNDFLTHVQAGLTAQQGTVLNQNNVQQQQIRAQQTGLAQQKGDFKATFLADQEAAAQKARQEQAKIQASIAIADGKLDLARDVLNTVTKPKTNATIRQNDSRIKNDRARVRETKQQNRVNNAIKVNKLALDAYTKAHPELSTKGRKGKPAFTGTQKRKSASTFRSLSAQLDENAVHKDPNGAVNALVKGKKVDPVVANAIVESIRNHGSVTRETATLYYRATGHHLHVSPKAKKIPGDLGKIVGNFLGGL